MAQVPGLLDESPAHFRFRRHQEAAPRRGEVGQDRGPHLAPGNDPDLPNPKVIDICANEELLQKWKDANFNLQVVQKGLDDHQETKREAFARLYFLSSDELLEILSQTKDSTRVVPFLSKVFEAVNKAEAQPDMLGSMQKNKALTQKRKWHPCTIVKRPLFLEERAVKVESHLKP